MMKTAYGTRIQFTVKGQAIPQGSPKLGRHRDKHGVLKPCILLDSEKLRAWRQLVSVMAKRAIPDGAHWVLHNGSMSVFDEAVVVVARFFLRPPGRANFGDICSVKPDLDKLQRAIGDALEDAGIVSNDSRIVGWPACPAKIYGDPRTEISVMTLKAWERS